ncbi:MAG: hypothetical protein HC900_00125 [Methylacidiphilales bacterium]|nr:hypothetical protein [Candidatus Methylacidiphilales bacterium]
MAKIGNSELLSRLHIALLDMLGTVERFGLAATPAEVEQFSANVRSVAAAMDDFMSGCARDLAHSLPCGSMSAEDVERFFVMMRDALHDTAALGHLERIAEQMRDDRAAEARDRQNRQRCAYSFIQAE